MAEYRELQAAIDAIRSMERHDFEEDHFPDAEYAYNDGLIAAINAIADIPAAPVMTKEEWMEKLRAALDKTHTVSEELTAYNDRNGIEAMADE